MELVADDAFGLEAVTVAGVTKVLDVCGLADALYDAMNGVGDDLTAFKETQLAGAACAAVLVEYGFPDIPVPAAAFMFAARVCARGLELKKAVSDVWGSDGGPASHDSTADSTSAD
jgi:hypothetical protein